MNTPYTFNLGGRLMYFDRPAVMAILNVTPDSFFEGSRRPEHDQIRDYILAAKRDGAAVLDIGGYSTRPGADDISAVQELERLSMALEIAQREAPEMPVSIDTFRASVVQKIYDRFGAVIVNDIGGGTLDPAMLETVGRLGLPYIMGHIKGTPQTMAGKAVYDDMMYEIIQFFVRQIALARAAGIADLMIDPCFGFAKTADHNFALLKNLPQLALFDLPVLAGLSRKSMVFRTLGISPTDSLAGTVALNWQALIGGSAMLRVHDVLPAVQTIKLYECYEQAR